MRFDTMIIGAGPAGAMAARQASLGGARVAMVERCELPRRKVCGQFHHGRLWPELERMGLAGRIRLLSPLAIPDFSIQAGGRGATLPLAAPGFALCRSRFDFALVEAAREAGATVYAPCEAVPVRDGDGRWSIEHEGSTLEAPFLVVAEGRGSTFLARRSVPVIRRDPATVAFQGVFALAGDAPPRVELHVVSWGYIGVLAMGARESNFCPVVRADRIAGLKLTGGAERILKRLLELACAEDASLREHFAGAELATPVQTSRFVSTARPERMHGEGWLLAGDSAGATEPFTGEGIWRAFVSGALAGNAAARIAAGEDEVKAAADYRRELAAAVGRGARLNGLLRPAMFSPGIAGAVSRLAMSNRSLAGALARWATR